MRFNPPPDWPVLKGWEPGPDWRPPSSWPEAPPGWTFWVADDAAAHTPTRYPAATPASDPDVAPPASDDGTPRRRRLRDLPIPTVAAAVAISVLTVTALVLLIVKPTPSTQPESEVIDAHDPFWINPDWPSGNAFKTNFSTWTRFGGIDATFSDDGRTVLLNTHDTTETWRTKWSGLIEQGPPMCGMRFTGRVRDVSHTPGINGGFGVGLATLGPGSPDTAELTGSAIQFDFGQRGFRTAVYPSDADHGLVSAALDHEWHSIEVEISQTSHTMVVDGKTVVQNDADGTCGDPVIRVWAGAVEFADFSFG